MGAGTGRRDGPIPNSSIIKHELELFDRAMLTLGLIALGYICIRMIKD